ncbi:MAG: hypothetical protein EHM79_00335 [Geobacter sp.]|nr:MAG: hypothetical protein EHM79_00335 [Geobacter sp.]
MKINLYKPDGWTAIHFMMGLGVALIVRSLKGSRWMAFGIALMFCTGWEMLDALYAGQWIFDPRGADLIDIVVGALGAAIAVTITD